MRLNRDWIGAGAGFLYVVLSIVGGAIGGDHPSSIGPIEDIKSRFLTNPGPFAIQAASYIAALAMLPFVVFGIRIAQRLWLGGQQWLAAAALSGAVLVAAIELIENSLLSVLAYSVASDGDAGAIKALYGLRHILIVYIYVPEAMIALAIAWASLAAGVFRRWYGWLSALMGLLLLGAAADLTRTGIFRVQGDVWFYTLLLLLLWTLLTSGMLLTRQRTVSS
jgi:hypothetical protein